MMRLAFICLVLALILFTLGFGGTTGSLGGVAEILFVVSLVLAGLSYLGGGLRRKRLD